MTSPGEFLPRLLARGIDVVVLLVILLGLGRLIGFGFDWLLIGTVTVVAYFVLLDSFIGTTPGKRALGLRVVGPDGGRPSVQQSLLRESFTTLGAVPFAGPLLALAAWIWIAVTIRASPLRQGPHDRLAGGTRVVRV